MHARRVIPLQRIPDKRQLADKLANGISKSPKQHHSINIAITKSCFLACAHCYESASPKRRETLDQAAFPKILDNLNELNGGNYPDRYYITGGDPMRKPEETLAVCRELEARGDAWQVLVRTTGISAASERGREFFRQLAELPHVKVWVGLLPFQRKYLLETIGSDGVKLAGMMNRAYEALHGIFGERLQGIPFLHFKEDEIKMPVRFQPILPFGRGSSREHKKLWEPPRDECHCHSISYCKNGRGELEAVSDYADLIVRHMWVDFKGGLHLTKIPMAPILNLAAENPLETIDPRSLAAHLLCGGPLYAAQELLKMKHKKILAYYKEGKLCHLCYELKLELHPELC